MILRYVFVGFMLGAIVGIHWSAAPQPREHRLRERGTKYLVPPIDMLKGSYQPDSCGLYDHWCYHG